jgi:serine/threonine protein kinase
MAARVGEQLGNYHLKRLLGQGGFAQVDLGEHIYLHTLAALKVLQTELSEQDVDNFVQEAQTLAHLSHPHIVRMLDFAVEDGTPFLVIEYAPHGTMRQRYPKGTRLPVETIVSYVQQIRLLPQNIRTAFFRTCVFSTMAAHVFQVTLEESVKHRF